MPSITFNAITSLFRFGYGDDGKAFEHETTVLRGPCTFHTNGNMEINGIVYPPGDPTTANGMAEAHAFELAFNSTISELGGDDNQDANSDRFSAIMRRLSTHINPYNPIIQFLIRSNMDLKVLLRDSDAKGIFFYILNYATKTVQTLDVLLPLLLPVVERIRNESQGEPVREMAVRLVRSCLCKQLTSLNIGGPAAASKVFDLPDAKISHSTSPCPMGPLLAWASSRDQPELNNSNINRNGEDGSNSDEEGSDYGSGMIVSAVEGKLTVNQRAHLLYRNHCNPDDDDHPLHDMSYVVWHRLVRVERYRALPKSSKIRGGDYSEDNADSNLSEEDPDHIIPKNRKLGRAPCNRYGCVGEYSKNWVQVISSARYVSLPILYLFTYVSE